MPAHYELIDTHAHLYLPEFDEDRDAVIRRATEAGVKKIFLPNIDGTTVDAMMRMALANPGFCIPMMGLHPCSVKADYKQELVTVSEHLNTGAFAAVGEIGTDLYWDTTFREEQIACFKQQVALAKEHDLPIVIHSRETIDLNIDLVESLQDGSLSGIFHCFTGSADQGRRILDLGFYLGIGGVVTFKNSGLAAVISELPMEGLVLETDAPFLSPHPNRGKRNESAYLPLVVQKIADTQGMTFEEVCETTTRNANAVFKTGV